MNTDAFFQFLIQGIDFLQSLNFFQYAATSSTSFVLIVAAEIGDKSQLVCMTLASRHRALPVILGASAAFAFLNTLAVVFGATIADWVPEYIIAAIVCLLFSLFGVLALVNHAGEIEGHEVLEKSNVSIFFTAFLLINFAEFGDKTQLAVVAMSSATNPYAVWIGATAALVFISALGVWAGQAFMRKIPLALIQRISGIIFLCLAIVAGIRAYQLSAKYANASFNPDSSMLVNDFHIFPTYMSSSSRYKSNNA